MFRPSWTLCCSDFYFWFLFKSSIVGFNTSSLANLDCLSCIWKPLRSILTPTGPTTRFQGRPRVKTLGSPCPCTSALVFFSSKFGCKGTTKFGFPFSLANTKEPQEHPAPNLHVIWFNSDAHNPDPWVSPWGFLCMTLRMWGLIHPNFNSFRHFLVHPKNHPVKFVRLNP